MAGTLRVSEDVSALGLVRGLVGLRPLLLHVLDVAATSTGNRKCFADFCGVSDMDMNPAI